MPPRWILSREIIFRIRYVNTITCYEYESYTVPI